MVVENSTETASIVLPLLAFLYVLAMLFYEKHFANRSVLTDEERLTRLARTRCCSEYDLFTESAQNWRFSKQKIDADFKTYLIDGFLPHYIRAFVRKHQNEIDKGSSKAGERE